MNIFIKLVKSNELICYKMLCYYSALLCSMINLYFVDDDSEKNERIVNWLNYLPQNLDPIPEVNPSTSRLNNNDLLKGLQLINKLNIMNVW